MYTFNDPGLVLKCRGAIATDENPAVRSHWTIDLLTDVNCKDIQLAQSI